MAQGNSLHRKRTLPLHGAKRDGGKPSARWSHRNRLSASQRSPMAISLQTRLMTVPRAPITHGQDDFYFVRRLRRWLSSLLHCADVFPPVVY